MKRIVSVIFVVFVLLSTSVTAFAVTDLDEFYEQVDVEEIAENVPDETKDLLKELGLDEIDFQQIINISPKQIFSVLEKILSGVYQSPFKCAFGIIGIIFLSSILKAFQTTFDNSSINSVFSLVCAILVSSIIVVRVSDCISNACSVIKLSSSFSFVFIPIFTLLVALGGNPLAAATFNTVLLTLAQVLNNLASTFLLPFLNIFFGIGIVSGIRPELHLSSIVSFFKKNILLVISFLSSGFLSLLTIKSSVTSAVDFVGEKSIKFAITSFVPVIGGAISEGLSSINGYVSLAKSTVGIFGIVSILLIYLPSVLEVLIWYISMGFCGLCSDVFEESSVKLVIKAIEDTLLILLVVLIFSLILSLVSLGLMISVKGGSN